MKQAKVHRSRPGGQPGKAAKPVIHEPRNLAEMAEILHGLPPLKVTADWNSNDAKYKRIGLPSEYWCRVKDLPRQWAIAYHPRGCLHAVPTCLGAALFDEIKRELQAKRAGEWIDDIESNRQEAELDDRGRWRLSGALTDLVGIDKKVVISCCHGWIQIWAKEVRDAWLKFPGLPNVSQLSPASAAALPAKPG